MYNNMVSNYFNVTLFDIFLNKWLRYPDTTNTYILNYYFVNHFTVDVS